MKNDILNDIISLNDKIIESQLDSIIEVIQSINSLTILYDHQSINYETLKSWLEQLYLKKSITHKASRILWKIPVCYDEVFGLDLQELSKRCGLPINKVIKIHTQAIYKIYSIGFLPGFLYLGGLDKRLHSARKDNPRLEILKGAVGIGGEQTGVYPAASPGGWQIIGNTPISLFDITKDIPCFAKPGDEIQFIPISISRHKAIVELISLDEYTIETEVIRD